VRERQDRRWNHNIPHSPNEAGNDNTEPLPPISDELSPAEGMTAQSHTADFLLTFAEPTVRRRNTFGSPERRTLRRLLTGAVAATVVAAVISAVWLLWPRSTSSSGEVPSQASSNVDSADEQQLRTTIPAGFDPAACQPEPRRPGTTAQVACGPNTDPGGPASSRFMLAERGADLQVLLRSSLDGAQVVTCPGNIQSPGPWRRNATPTQIAGTLICAVRGDRATVAWSTDDKDLVSVTTGGENGPTLTQLYAWWTTHS
jgi:hypothetical protein